MYKNEMMDFSTMATGTFLGSIRQNGENKPFLVSLESDSAKDMMRKMASIPILRRYLTKDLSDIIPLVFIMFAKYCKSTVSFDSSGHIVDYEKKDGKDGKLLDDLHWHTMGIVGESGKCRAAEELKKELEKIDYSLYREVLPKFLVCYITGRKSIYDTQFWPVSLMNTIVNILTEVDAKKIYEYKSGFGLLHRSYTRWELYSAYEPSFIKLFYSRIIDHLLNAPRLYSVSSEYLRAGFKDGYTYDTIIASLLDNGREPKEHLREVISLFENVIRTTNDWKTSVIIVDYHFCVSPSYENIRKELCKKKLLDTVLMFRASKIGKGAIAIIILNKQKNDDCVLFKTEELDGKSETRTNYHEFEKRHWVFEPQLYEIEGPGKNNRFSDLIDGFIHSENMWDTAIQNNELHINLSKPKSEVGISEEDFHSSPVNAFLNVVPHSANDDFTSWSSVVHGPAVSILFDKKKKFKVCRVDSETTFLVPKSSLTFRVSNNADIKYVINALFTDRNLVNTLNGVEKMNDCFVRENINVDEEYLYGIIGNSPIDDFPDKEHQIEKVRSIEDSLKEVLKTNTEYKILLVGNPLDDKEKGELAQWLVSIAGETSTIEGKGSLKQLLEEDSNKPDSNINAVVIDTSVGYDENEAFKYVGVWKASRLASQNMPVFLYTDKPWEEFGPMANMLLDSLKSFGGYVQKTDSSSIKNLIRRIRYYLDEYSSPSTTVKRDYSQEIYVANLIDPTGAIAHNIIEYLGSEIMDSWGKLNQLRIAADTIFNNAKEVRKILPDMIHLGQFQQLMLDGEYFDNNTMTMYRIRKDFMPETLAVALGYFVKITNPASHGASEKHLNVKGYILTRSKSSNIFKSCLYILLDLLRWYKEVTEMDQTPKYEVIEPYQSDDQVINAVIAGKNYYYLGRVHLESRNGIEGLPGSRVKLNKVTKEKKPINGDIIFYSNNYDIIK